MPVMRRWTGSGSTLRLCSISATILLALAGVAALTISGGGKVAFSQVLDKVRQVDSVAFAFSPGRGDAAEREQKCLLQGTRLRVEHPSGIVVIADKQSQEGLYLDAKNKTAGRFTLHEQATLELAGDPIEQLRKVRSANAERLPNEVVAGKQAEVFRIRGLALFGMESDQGEMRVWVDPSTMLPLRIELRKGETPVATLKDLKWNAAVDPALLALEAPVGYSDESPEYFQKLLRPEAAADQKLTPTEAFRKWSRGNK